MADGLHILYTNDLHNRWGAFGRIEEFRRPHSLLLDAGDAIAGSNTVFYWKEPILSHMRRLGYVAQAMGNREQHYFRWLLRWREQERQFPLLACNLQDLRQPQQAWRSWCHCRHPHLRVLVVGATPVQYRAHSAFEKMTGLRFLDPHLCIPPLLEELRPQADVLILLSHLGLKLDLELAGRGLPVDLILGGHSHDLTPDPLRRGSTVVVQGGYHGRYLGELYWEPGRLDWRAHPCL